MIFLVLLYVLVMAYIYFDPYLDITDERTILWYTINTDRKYSVLWSKK